MLGIRRSILDPETGNVEICRCFPQLLHENSETALQTGYNISFQVLNALIHQLLVSFVFLRNVADVCCVSEDSIASIFRVNLVHLDDEVVRIKSMCQLGGEIGENVANIVSIFSPTPSAHM
jgi:hypothetical protein